MKNFSQCLAAALTVTLFSFLSGCASTAPQYQVANSNVQALSVGAGKVAVGKFGYGAKGTKLNQLTIRGGSYDSPVEKSWAAYLQEALKAELVASNRLTDNADAVITGVLLENDLDGSGANIGTAHISAKFVVTRSGHITYERQLTIDKQWESSFIGGIAIPLARQSYIAAMSELLGKLFTDTEFIRAIQ